MITTLGSQGVTIRSEGFLVHGAHHINEERALECLLHEEGVGVVVVA